MISFNSKNIKHENFKKIKLKENKLPVIKESLFLKEPLPDIAVCECGWEDLSMIVKLKQKVIGKQDILKFICVQSVMTVRVFIILNFQN